MLIISFLLICILLGIFTEFFGNAWCLLTCLGYIIPKESNMFIFKVTKDNDGSGEWWLYGEDKKYYYGFDINENNYYKKIKGEENNYFDKFDYKTWENNE
jgi:hypothetical protein